MRVDRGTLRLGAACAALAVAAVGVYVPASRARAALLERLSAAEADVLGGRASDAEIARLHGTVAELRDVSSRPQRRVPAEDGLPDVVQGITEATAESGVMVDEIVVDDAETFRDYSLIPVRVAFQGTFPEAYDALRRLEAESRLIRFDKLEIVGDEADAEAPLTTKLELSAFFSPENGDGDAGPGEPEGGGG